MKYLFIFIFSNLILIFLKFGNYINSSEVKSDRLDRIECSVMDYLEKYDPSFKRFDVKFSLYESDLHEGSTISFIKDRVFIQKDVYSNINDDDLLYLVAHEIFHLVYHRKSLNRKVITKVKSEILCEDSQCEYISSKSEMFARGLVFRYWLYNKKMIQINEEIENEHISYVMDTYKNSPYMADSDVFTYASLVDLKDEK